MGDLSLEHYEMFGLDDKVEVGALGKLPTDSVVVGFGFELLGTIRN